MNALNRRIETRVGTLAAADHGSGIPVVMWPSLFSDHRLYRHVRRALGDRWRTVCVDGPGFGRSSPPHGDVQPDRYADAVIDLLDALEIEAAVISGCSWGGQVAAHVGARSPRRAMGVLMMNTPLEPSTGRAHLQVVGTRVMGSTAFWGRGVARSMMAPSTMTSHPERVDDFVSAFRSFDRSAAATTVRTVLARSPGLAAVLPLLQVPTTILMGAADALYPPKRALPLARLVAAARVDVIPSCGHLAPVESPEVVAKALQALVGVTT